jgi:hypothetical protein
MTSQKCTLLFLGQYVLQDSVWPEAFCFVQYANLMNGSVTMDPALTGGWGVMDAKTVPETILMKGTAVSINQQCKLYIFSYN